MDKKTKETIERYQKRRSNRIQIKKYKERRAERLRKRTEAQNKQDNSTKNTQFEQIYNLQQRKPSHSLVSQHTQYHQSLLQWF